MKPFNWKDRAIEEFDAALRTVRMPQQRAVKNKNPGHAEKMPTLSSKEEQHVAGLMRVNHSGEVCAQALYRGQALTAKLPKIRQQMDEAAQEENDHLAWCEERLQELRSKPSLLNPVWYGGSLLLGAIAGAIGDRWSLGFVAETERQVTAHLEKHLQRLPEQDKKTKRILSQMQQDEIQHAELACKAGAAELPPIIRHTMRLVSKIMTLTSYYV